MGIDQKSGRVASLTVLSSAALAVTATAGRAGAAVVVTNVNKSIGFAASDVTSESISLPGGSTFAISASTYNNNKSHTLAMGGTTNANFHVKTQVTATAAGVASYAFARPLAAGAKFTDPPAGNGAVAFINFVTSKGADSGPGTFANQYYDFSFVDNGQTLYGWIQGSLTDTSYAGLTYTFARYAYDTSGAVLPAGQTNSVPEPTTAGLAGLLVAGAAGVRRHKRDRRPADAARV